MSTYVKPYSAPPVAELWNKATLSDLREALAEIIEANGRGGVGTDDVRDECQTCIDLLIESDSCFTCEDEISSNRCDTHTVYIARDEDGFFFATGKRWDNDFSLVEDAQRNVFDKMPSCEKETDDRLDEIICCWLDRAGLRRLTVENGWQFDTLANYAEIDECVEGAIEEWMKESEDLCDCGETR